MKKILLSLWKKYRKDLTPVLFLVGLSFYAWRFLPTWIMQFEGFTYFDPTTINTYLSNIFKLLSTAQVAGVLLGSILPKILGVNMSLYMWVQLIAVLFIGLLFYVVMKVVTKNRFIAFAVSLMFTINYFGNFDTIFINYSVHFLERGSVNIIFLLLSFLFLHLFLEKVKQKYYIISLVCYFFGVLSSHFSILFTGPYFLYPFFWYLFNKKNVLKGFAAGMSYILISGFFVYIQGIGMEPIFREHASFFQFILNPQKYHYPEGMLMQLVSWSQYPSLIKALIFDLYPFSYFNYETLLPLRLPISIVYISISLIIYKALPNKRALLFTTILGTASIFLLNIYLGRYDPFYTAGASRYLYFPTYLLAIFWSLFLWVLFKNKNLGLKLIAIIFLVSYYYINAYLIFSNFSRMHADARPQKAIFNYIITARDKLKSNTLVLGQYPAIRGYEGRFFTTQLGRGQVTYLSDSANISNWPIVASSSSHVIRFKYNIECQCVLEETLK